MRWSMKVTNESIRRQSRIDPISEQVRRRGWTWIGHVLMMLSGDIARTSLTWTPEGKRLQGILKETWPRTVERGARRHGASHVGGGGGVKGGCRHGSMENGKFWQYSPRWKKEISQVKSGQ